MNVATIAGLLRERAQLRTHDGWTRDEVLAYQARRLVDLRAHATANSPFYRDLHRGLEGAPLSALPVVTKATLLHRYEDLVIAELVDDDNQPVPEGEYGVKTLVTVLFSRTQPLIRYELSDRVAAAPGMASDLPFSLLAGIEGREEEVLTLGGVSVHPNVFHGALERLPVSGWQVIDEGGRVRVLLAGAANIDAAVTAESVRGALERVGAHDVQVAVDSVDAIPRTAIGKAPLIRRAQLATLAR